MFLNTRLYQSIILVLTALYITSYSCPTTASDIQAPRFAEKLLATIPSDIHILDACFRPDGKAVTYKAGKVVDPGLASLGRGWGIEYFIVSGNIKSDNYIRVSTPIYYNMGKDISYEASKENGKQFLVINHQQTDKFNNITWDVSPDQKAIAYVGSNGNGCTTVINGNEHGNCWYPIFGPDSRYYALSSGTANKRHIQYNMKAYGIEYDDADRAAISPDGTLVYTARKGNKYFVVINNKKQREYDGVGKPVISSDGGIIAYTVHLNGKRGVVINGKLGELFEEVCDPVISADGSRIAYAAMKDKKWYIISDDIYWGPLDHIEGNSYMDHGQRFSPPPPILSPKGNRIAYKLKKYNKWHVIINNIISKDLAFDYVDHIVFSPDGTRCAYVAYDYGNRQIWESGNSIKCHIVIDGVIGRPHDSVSAPIFSIQGKHVAYIANDSLYYEMDGSTGYEMNYVVVDDIICDVYDKIWAPVFGKDENSIAFGALKGRELWWKVMDVK